LTLAMRLKNDSAARKNKSMAANNKTDFFAQLK